LRVFAGAAAPAGEAPLALLAGLLEAAEALVLLGSLESDRLGGGALLPVLELEAVVGARILDGTLAGRVGDFTLGLTISAAGARFCVLVFLPRGCGFNDVFREVLSLGTVAAGFLSGALAVSWVDPLAGLLGTRTAEGDPNI
jgi:hypothetical protein